MQHLPIEIIGEISSFLTERKDFSNFLLCSKMIFPAKETVGAQKRIEIFKEENEIVKSVLKTVDETLNQPRDLPFHYHNLDKMVSLQNIKIKKLLLKKDIAMVRYMLSEYPDTVDLFYFALNRITSKEQLKDYVRPLNITYRSAEEVFNVQLKLAEKFGLEIVRYYFQEVVVKWDPIRKIWRKKRIYKPRQTKTQ